MTFRTMGHEPLQPALDPEASRAALKSHEGFVFEVLQSADVGRFAGDRPRSAQAVTCQLMLDGSDPVLLVADGDGVRLEAPGAGPVDVRLSADPGTMWLLMCRRVNPLRALIRRDVKVTGPRPWRLRRLMRAVATP